MWSKLINTFKTSRSKSQRVQKSPRAKSESLSHKWMFGLAEVCLCHTSCLDPFNIYESCSVLWKELVMSVFTVLEELQVPKSWWVVPGLVSHEGRHDGQATSTSWHPAVRVQDYVKCPSKYRIAPAVDILVGQQLPCLLAYFLIKAV